MESKLRAALNCTCRLLGADCIWDFTKEEFVATEPPLIRTQRVLHTTRIVHLSNYLKTYALGYHQRCSPEDEEVTIDRRAHATRETGSDDLARTGRIVGDTRADPQRA